MKWFIAVEHVDSRFRKGDPDLCHFPGRKINALQNLLLRAPVSGQLSLLDAEIGEQKLQGQRLGQIDGLEGYKVRAYIDEYYISRSAESRP